MVSKNGWPPGSWEDDPPCPWCGKAASKGDGWDCGTPSRDFKKRTKKCLSVEREKLMAALASAESDAARLRGVIEGIRVQAAVYDCGDNIMSVSPRVLGYVLEGIAKACDEALAAARKEGE